MKYIDDLDDELEDEDPLFKVQKINLRNEKANFLALLNKPTEEVNKEKINDDDFNYHGRFNIDDLEEVEEYELNNNADNINLENEKINEDSTPNLDENKIYHIDYNKIVENNNNNANSNEEDSDKKDEKEVKSKKISKWFKLKKIGNFLSFFHKNNFFLFFFLFCTLILFLF